MSTFEILPPGRAWYPGLEQRAQSLVDGAKGDRGQLAALSLLFRDPGLTFFAPEVLDAYTVGADVRWLQLHWWAAGLYSAAYAIESHRRSRSVIMLACSMASEVCEVRLGDALAELDEDTRKAFVDAMAYFAGRVD